MHPRARICWPRLGLALAACLAAAMTALADAQQKVLRAVLHADVRVLDPIWTTQTIANIHGMLVYDTLFGNDDGMQPKPQMVDTYDITEDKLVYTFTLRDKLKFHDGSPVTTKDVMASLERWGKKRRRRHPPVLVRRQARGHRRQDLPHDAEANPTAWCWNRSARPTRRWPSSCATRMRRPTRSSRSRRRSAPAPSSSPRTSGCRAARRCTLGTPTMRPGPAARRPSSFAGSKFPGVDRIELVWISDPQTAMSALINGEIDFYENPNIDFYPILEKARGVKLMKTGKLNSTHGMIRLNHLHPPFNNVKARQAMYHLINQENFLRAIVGDPKYYRICHGLITCGSPLGNDGGSAWLKEYNPKKALQLLKEAGYNGEPITVLATTDHNTITPATQVLIQAMREAGINVDAQSMDWGSVVSRRAKKEPPAQGGWNIFVTTTGGVGVGQPGAAHLDRRRLRQGRCSAGRATPRSRSCSNDYAFALKDEEKTKIARDLQTRAIEQVVYIPFGQWDQMLAYRSDRLEGIVPNTGWWCSGTSPRSRCAICVAPASSGER